MRGGVEERECGEIRGGDQQGVVDVMIIPVSSPPVGRQMKKKQSGCHGLSNMNAEGLM